MAQTLHASKDPRVLFLNHGFNEFFFFFHPGARSRFTRGVGSANGGHGPEHDTRLPLVEDVAGQLPAHGAQIGLHHRSHGGKDARRHIQRCVRAKALRKTGCQIPATLRWCDGERC